MKYIRIYTKSKSMNSYYYEEQTGEMFILEQSKGGNGLSVGIWENVENDMAIC